MKILIEINCLHSALHDNLIGELTRILGTVPEKVAKQLERDGRCICEALEGADKLRDINGNTVGTVFIERDLNLRDKLRKCLTDLGCIVRTEAGIWNITTLDGQHWDMTVPMSEEEAQSDKDVLIEEEQRS